MKMSKWMLAAALGAALLGAGAFPAQAVEFKDPTGDDFGPGNYVYPTDTVYKAGSFDMTAFALEADGKKANVSVTLNSALEDPWGMKVGFAVQMIFIFIDTDGKAGSGFTDGIHGLNDQFAPADARDKAIVLSPQCCPQSRLMTR